MNRQWDAEVPAKGHVSSNPICPYHSAYNFSHAFPQERRKEEGDCLVIFILACAGGQTLRTETRETADALMYL